MVVGTFIYFPLRHFLITCKQAEKKANMEKKLRKGLFGKGGILNVKLKYNRYFKSLHSTL